MDTGIEAILSIGSNLGNRRENLVAVCSRIERFAHILHRSKIYETEPVGYLNQPYFLNAALHISSALSPNELLESCLQSESDLGRERSFKNAPRTVDIDIIFIGKMESSEPHLTLPHPRWKERGFVVTPLLDLLELGAFSNGELQVWKKEIENMARSFLPFGAF